MPTRTTCWLNSLRSAISWAMRVSARCIAWALRMGVGFIVPWPPRRAALKERLKRPLRAACSLLLPAFTPLGTVFDDPVSQRSFESNIAARFLRLDPFMLQNFLPFRLKFPVQRRVLQQIT